MICAYALEGTEPETDNWILNLLFYAVKPLIDNCGNCPSRSRNAGKADTENLFTLLYAYVYEQVHHFSRGLSQNPQTKRRGYRAEAPV